MQSAKSQHSPGLIQFYHLDHKNLPEYFTEYLSKLRRLQKHIAREALNLSIYHIHQGQNGASHRSWCPNLLTQYVSWAPAACV